MDKPSIRAENVQKSFVQNGKNLPVLDGISVSAEAGQVISILGKSGCGKSTFLNILAGLESHDGGSVEVEGKIGYVPQTDALLPWRTAMENILLPIEINRGDIQASARQAKQLLEKSHLAQFANSYPDDMSGGMRQRISLIRMFIQNPDVILFDEPFSSLDFDMRIQLGKQAREYVVSSKKVALFITHNIEEAIALGDQLVIFSNRPGKVIHTEKINVAEKDRDAVAIRKTEDFQRVFETSWSKMTSNI